MPAKSSEMSVDRPIERRKEHDGDSVVVRKDFLPGGDCGAATGRPLR